MDDFSLMISNQRKYKNLKENIKLIVENLNLAIGEMETPVNKISESYNIDSQSIDGGKINSVRQDLINRRNYLNNVILVEIDKELEELKNNIESM